MIPVSVIPKNVINFRLNLFWNSSNSGINGAVHMTFNGFSASSSLLGCLHRRGKMDANTFVCVALYDLISSQKVVRLNRFPIAKVPSERIVP